MLCRLRGLGPQLDSQVRLTEPKQPINSFIRGSLIIRESGIYSIQMGRLRLWLEQRTRRLGDSNWRMAEGGRSMY